VSADRVFRASPLYLAYLGLQAALLGGATWLLWRQGGWDWLTITLALVTVVIGGGGLAEAWRTRIDLRDDALVITTLWGIRHIARRDIATVRAERGSPPAVQLTDGSWVRLPSLGKQVARAVGAWLTSS
jgi:hypothetical protein